MIVEKKIIMLKHNQHHHNLFYLFIWLL